MSVTISCASELLEKDTLELPRTARNRSSARVARNCPPIVENHRDRRRVLLIENHRPTADAVITALGTKGYQAVRCPTPATAPAMATGTDFILLNLELPGADCISLLAELRLTSVAPILAYSTRTEVESVVVALQCGADDYLVAPIRPLELIARMQAIIRRANAYQASEQVVRVGDLVIRLQARTVEVGRQSIRLTPRQFDVLAVLARNAGTSVSRGDIMLEVWGKASLATSRTLDVHMTAVRAKLARPNLLLTVHGFGYRLGANPTIAVAGQ